MDRQRVIEEVASWIDTNTIAEMIVSHLEDMGNDVTVESCKNLWYITLENIGGGVRLAV